MYKSLHSVSPQPPPPRTENKANPQSLCLCVQFSMVALHVFPQTPLCSLLTSGQSAAAEYVSQLCSLSGYSSLLLQVHTYPQAVELTLDLHKPLCACDRIAGWGNWLLGGRSCIQYCTFYLWPCSGSPFSGFLVSVWVFAVPSVSILYTLCQRNHVLILLCVLHNSVTNGLIFCLAMQAVAT